MRISDFGFRISDFGSRVSGLRFLFFPNPEPRTPRLKGQTLVIALIVTFVLVFLGAVFVGLIARNILNVQRGREDLNAQYFAEAGIRFALDQLVNSEEGADWRPQPDNLTSNDSADPDYRWLKIFDSTDGTGGYTRINFGKGRALIRVEYDPQNSRFILVRSIGRVGEVNRNDPTTLESLTAIPRRRELVAYVQIGTIDYLRFVMNHERRSTPMELGAREIGLPDPNSPNESLIPRTILGTPAAPNEPFGLAPIRVNGTLKWVGRVELFLDKAAGERIEVAGDILHDEDTTVTLTVRDQAGNLPTLDQFTMLPSLAPGFFTAGGIYRDGRNQTAIDGYPRAINYIEPPRMDTTDPATGQMRYRALTRDSGAWRQTPEGDWFNSGQFGYGRGIYINNTQDIQQEVRRFIGGYSLRSDWLNPGGSRHWNGPFYEPPGAYIELFDVRDPNNPNNVLSQGFRITRNLSNANDIWRNPFTAEVTNVKSLVFFFRTPNDPTDPRLYNEFTQNLPDNGIEDPVPRQPARNVAFNGVIFTEGNVRIRGMIPSNRQITIVTNGTAYIEGNLLKGNNRSALAVIARDYVCVNTTQFLKRTWDSPASAETDPLDSKSPFHFEVLPGKPLGLQFSFGETPSYTGNFDGLKLFVRHASSGAGSFINLLLNPGQGANPVDEFYHFGLTGLPDWVYRLDTPYTSYEKAVFPLRTPFITNNALNNLLRPGIENLLLFRLDQEFVPPGNNLPYYWSAAAVQPCDIKIQAVLYAQNGSFFVIPGYWFNLDPDDVRTRPRLTPREFPFYGDPLDVRITIEGAISENFTASLNDQSQWLRHWGWIPLRYGDSSFTIPDQHQQWGGMPAFHDIGEPNPQYAMNLFMRYDPMLRSGRDGNTPLRIAGFTDPSGAHPGRILPPLPKLPVCPKAIYVGELRP